MCDGSGRTWVTAQLYAGIPDPKVSRLRTDNGSAFGVCAALLPWKATHHTNPDSVNGMRSMAFPRR